MIIVVNLVIVSLIMEVTQGTSWKGASHALTEETLREIIGEKDQNCGIALI